MKIEKKKLIWIGLIIILVVAAIFYIGKIKTGAVAVDMGLVEKGNIREYIEENAVVRLEEETQVYAPLGGKVVSVMFKTGISK